MADESALHDLTNPQDFQQIFFEAQNLADESAPHGLTNPQDFRQIFLEAQNRWLRPAEICQIIRNYKSFHIAQRYVNRPPSGSLFLVNQKVRLYFTEQDGYKWMKKKDGMTKEEHKRLQIGSFDTLYCNYAFGEENVNFQRRTYWTVESALSHILLVHYLDTQGGYENSNDQQVFRSKFQSGVYRSDDQTSILSGLLANQSILPDSIFHQEALCKDFHYPYLSWKTFFGNEKLRKNCKSLNRKKDVLLLFLSYPMTMMDKDKSQKWIADVLEIMRDLKSTENFFCKEALEDCRVRARLAACLEKQLDVPLMNDVKRLLPRDMLEKLCSPTEANLGPLLELDRKLSMINRKTAESKGLSLHNERAVMETGKELQLGPTSCITQEEDGKVTVEETLYVPQEIFDLAVGLAVRQTVECVSRGDIKRIRVTGRDETKVMEAIMCHRDLSSKFRFVIVRPSENQGEIMLLDAFDQIDLKRGVKLIRLFSTVDLKPAFSDDSHPPGILLLMEDSNKKMKGDQLTVPSKIYPNALDNLMRKDSSFIIFTSKMAADMEIRTEDHLLSWELFCRNAGEALLSPIQQIAAHIVRECCGNLLAIILMARFLKKVINDVHLWELAADRLAMRPSFQIEDVDDVLVNALIIIWEHMDDITRHCIKLCTWYSNAEKIYKLSLINHWIQDRLVYSYDEGTFVLQSLADAFLVSVESDWVHMQRDIYIVLIKFLIHRMDPVFERQGGLRLTEPSKEEEWDAREIHLMDNKLSELPESPKCPSLIALYLRKCLDLMAIPSCFFKHMPLLQILDLSYTSLKTLPESLSSLVKLRELLLKGCELFMELPPHVGKLKNLEKLDLDETHIIDLPVEISNLSKLKFLRVSFYGYMNCSKMRLQRDTIILPGLISCLTELNELSIDVDPDDERWNETVKAIIEEACGLKSLIQLNLYLPNIELLWRRRAGRTSLLHYPLPGFRFTVGYHKQQVISVVPEEVEARFKKEKKCLKFVKGKDIPAEMKMALNHSTALFLDGHATARSLSDFGIENIKQLKFCLLAECNEIQTIIDCGEFQEEQTDALENLQYLNIYYMKKLESIWRRPIHKHCLGNLKLLGLHKCPKLSTIFSLDFIANLAHLEELIVEHCPQLNSLVSLSGCAPCYSALQPHCFLPSLKRISLLYVPELTSISSGLRIAPELERAGFYNCPKLERLSTMEMSSETLKVIKGESKWWEALQWNESEWGNRQYRLHTIFSPIIKERDVKTQLAEEGVVYQEPKQKRILYWSADCISHCS